MKRLTKNQAWAIAAVVGIATIVAYILWGGLEQNLVYFVTPTELAKKGPAAIGNPVRLGGVVLGGTVHFESTTLTFDLTDDVHTVPVVTTKTPPQMFQEGMGVVVEGALGADGRFAADRLMVKHGNEYRPPKEGEMPQEIYKALQATSPDPSLQRRGN